MKRDSFVTYRSFYEAVKSLDYETIGKVYVAINEYALDHNEVECEGIIKTIFTLIKPQLEASFQKAISGSKGGKVSKSQSSEELEDKEERNISTLEANPKQNESKTKANNKQTLSKAEANSKQNGSKQEANSKQTASNANANVNANVNVVKKKKNIKKEKSIAEQIEDYTQNEELKEGLNAFVEARSKTKKPLTEYAFKLHLAELDQLTNYGDDNSKIQIINQTLKKGYLSFYKVQNSYQEKHVFNEPIYDDSKNINATDEQLEALRKMRGIE